MLHETPPLNLLGDFAGGSLYLVAGMLAALVERAASGRGQVVDAAIVDGTAHLMTAAYGSLAAGMHNLERGTNSLDSGWPLYDVYECADGGWISIAPVEPKFQRVLFDRIGLDGPPDGPDLAARLADCFRRRTRDEWCALLEGTDACFAPVLDMAEAPLHPHNRERRTFVEVEGVTRPAAAPRFSRSSAAPGKEPDATDAGGTDALRRWGISDARIDRWRSSEDLRAD